MSAFGIVAAAVASIATSQEPVEPDWVLDESASGEIRIEPTDDTRSFRFRASSRGTRAAVQRLALKLDPEADRTLPDEHKPIVFFVTQPRPTTPSAAAEAGASPEHLRAVPLIKADAEGFESVLSSSLALPDDDSGVVFEVTVAWVSPNEHDSKAFVWDENARANKPVERPRAPRRGTTIRWRAGVHADGMGAPPPGARISIAAVP
jgi:hypothetical protein